MQPPEANLKSGPPGTPLPEKIDADIVVLPEEVEQDGVGLYSDSALDLVKELRLLDVTADYQHPQQSRTWIGERSFAAVAFEWIFGVSTNAGWAAICVLLRRNKGKAPGRVKIARCAESADEITWEWFEVEGDGNTIADALESIGFTPKSLGSGNAEDTDGAD
jgi:hypothetical protein